MKWIEIWAKTTSIFSKTCSFVKRITRSLSDSNIFLPQYILLCGVLMNLTINFDDHLKFIAVKIDDKAIDSMLTSEFNTIQPSIAKFSPQSILSRCRLTSHLTCKRS
jgi:hypothetical protein